MCYISQCNWYFPLGQILSLKVPSSLLLCVRRNISGLWVLCIFGVFKLSNNRSRKFLYPVHFAVSEMLLSGIAIKKGAVCLASRDPTKLLVQESRLVNASKPLNKHQEDSSRLVSSLFTTFGEREQGTVTWTTKHLKQSSLPTQKCKQSAPLKKGFAAAATCFNPLLHLRQQDRHAGERSCCLESPSRRRCLERLAQTETGAQRLAQTGTETGAQRLAQTETPKISGDLLSFLTFAKSVYKAAIAQVEWCGRGNQEGLAQTQPRRIKDCPPLPRLNE